MSSDLSRRTTDHDVIRRWVSARDGKPAHVAETASEGDTVGILRIEFPGDGADEGLEVISWKAFFDQFEAQELAFIYQDHTSDGELSRFNKFINRSEDESE